MTLHEYINQTDPQPDVKVVLDKSEYNAGKTVKVNPYCFHTPVYIPALTDRYNISEPYIWMGNSPQLFTRHPQTGELRGSIFFLPVDTPQPPEIIRFCQFLKVSGEFLDKWGADNPRRGGLQEHNARFKTAYMEFLNRVRETYALTDEDIAYWLA